MTTQMPMIRPNSLPGPDPVDLPHLIRAHGAARPDAVAVIAGEARLTWGEVARLMDQCAAYLQGYGVRNHDVLASLGGLTADHLILYLGTLAAGAAMAPMPVSATPETISGMVANCAPGLVLADASGQAAAGDINTLALDGLLDRIAGLAPASPTQIASSDGFDIIYSSGTTGTPKGIMHDHLFRGRQRARLGDAGYDETTRSLVSTPLYSNTTLAALLPALAGGGQIVLLPKFDASDFLTLSQRHQITHAMCVPVQYRRILAYPDFDRTDLSHYRTKLTTSAPLTADLAAEIIARWPGRMINIYGMTEGGVGCLMDCTTYRDKLHTVGRPVAGGGLLILGPDDQPAPQGEVGEIVGRSATMMTGYCNAPDLTRAALWEGPDGLPWMRSGDMGRIDDEGFLHVLDRTKDMINSGGFNVFAVDLEAVLLSCDAVKEAAVIAIPSAEWGETPLAFVVGDVAPDDLRDWANARLGKTQRISDVRILDALPRSEIGKVLKRELRAPFWPATPKEPT